MKSGSLPFLLIAAVVFWGCSTQKQTEPIGTLEHQTIDTGDKYLGYGGFLAYCEGDIVGLELHAAVKQPFFNLTQNGEFYFFGSKGRGPNEFLLPYSIQFVDGRTVGVLDAQTKIYSEFVVPNEGEGPKIEKEIRFQTVSSRIIKTAFDQYISLSLDDEKMFSLIDSTGSTVKTFFEYPYQNGNERNVGFRSYAYQGTLAANPSKTKFVYSSFRGEIIHFYSIEENNIEVITKIEKDYPLYKDESNREIKGVSYDAKGKNGYIATYATDNFVYAIYSGQTVLEQTEKRSVNFEGNTLHVFDWNGLLVREYELDVLCSYLCVSDDDTEMWAVVTDSGGEIKLASFDLKGEMVQEKNTGKKQDAEIQKAPRPTVPKPPEGRRIYGLDVRTRDNQHNEDTQRVLDSMLSLPGHVPLDLSSNGRYDVRIDTVGNTIMTIVILE